MVELNNCNELINFLVDRFNTPHVGCVMFQGCRVEFTGMSFNGFYAIINKEHPGYTFYVSDIGKGGIDNDEFTLQISGKFTSLDEIPTVILPSYVYQELLYILRNLNGFDLSIFKQY